MPSSTNQTGGFTACSGMAIPLCLHTYNFSTGMPSTMPMLLRQGSTTKPWEQTDLWCPVSSHAPCGIYYPARPYPGFQREAWMYLQRCGRGWNHHIQALTHSWISLRTQQFAFWTPYAEGMSIRNRREGRSSLYLPHSPHRKQKAKRQSRSPQRC